MGAWIETLYRFPDHGLGCVAPHVGAWIETLTEFAATISRLVAPHVGAWIETSFSPIPIGIGGSRPTWARGLKLANDPRGSDFGVAPHVGAWIETIDLDIAILYSCRAPRGRVD